MDIKPIDRVNVSEQVFNQLKQLLIDGKWKQGEKLPSENDLAEQFGVSRLTVRNALQKLVALNLIETRLGEGSFVKEVTYGASMNALLPAAYLNNDSFLEVIAFREIVEVGAVRLATEKAQEEDLEELEQMYADMEARSKDSKSFAEVDFAFHLKIALITGNTLVIQTYSILQDLLRSSVVDVTEKMGTQSGLYYHRKIIDAMRQKDAEAATDVMREHIKNNVSYYM